MYAISRGFVFFIVCHLASSSGLHRHSSFHPHLPSEVMPHKAQFGTIYCNPAVLGASFELLQKCVDLYEPMVGYNSEESLPSCKYGNVDRSVAASSPVFKNAKISLVFALAENCRTSLAMCGKPCPRQRVFIILVLPDWPSHG